MGKAARIKRQKSERAREHELRAQREGSPLKCAGCTSSLVSGQVVFARKVAILTQGQKLAHLSGRGEIPHLYCKSCEKDGLYRKTVIYEDAPSQAVTIQAPAPGKKLRSTPA